MKYQLGDIKRGGTACLKRFEDDRRALEWMTVPETAGQAYAR